jgi:hypothetical protein
MVAADFKCCLFVAQARYFFQQLVSGVSYCHAMVSLQTFLANMD